MGREVTSLLLSVLSILSLSGCYDSFGEWRKDEIVNDPPKANSSIKHIHSQYDDAGWRTISQDLIIEGRVSANDCSGNFFRSFIIENEGFAIEVLDGLYDSYVRFPLGTKVAIRLNGLALDRKDGVLRTGLKAGNNSYFHLEYMSSEAIVNKHITRLSSPKELEPRTTTLRELDESNAGEFITIENLSLHTESSEIQEWSGYQLFRDQNLDSIWCHTSEYATFAKSTIPTNAITLRGIVEYGETENEKDQLIIKLRNESDYTH